MGCCYLMKCVITQFKHFVVVCVWGVVNACLQASDLMKYVITVWASCCTVCVGCWCCVYKPVIWWSRLSCWGLCSSYKAILFSWLSPRFEFHLSLCCTLLAILYTFWLCCASSASAVHFLSLLCIFCLCCALSVCCALCLCCALCVCFALSISDVHLLPLLCTFCLCCAFLSLPCTFCLCCASALTVYILPLLCTFCV